ncbi:NAD(P)H-quinone oxidoreductase subunit 5 chloroplastic, partial [Dissostichus eleginoides]
WGAAPLAGPSRQGDPTCPRMADRLREGGLLALSLLYWGPRMLGPWWFQTAACVPVSKQLISFFNTQLPQHQAQVKDRLGSRDGGTEVEGEAIYPRRIRRCVTEVWTVAAGSYLRAASGPETGH